MAEAARFLGAWCGRLLLLLSGLVLVLVGTDEQSGSGIELLAIPVGAAFAGAFLLTFRTTARAGLWLAAAGAWAALTGYGLVALLDPGAVIEDSQRGDRGEVDSDGGAYLQGGFFLLVANLYPVLWTWGRVRGRRARRTPRH